MKRILSGALILAVLLAVGLGIAWKCRQLHNHISQLLEEAGTAAQAQQWEDARRLTHAAAAQWQRSRHFTAGFADHTPMDEIEATFAELQIYLDAQEAPHFQATCARLSLLTQSMADSQGLQWWNIL